MKDISEHMATVVVVGSLLGHHGFPLISLESCHFQDYMEKNLLDRINGNSEMQPDTGLTTGTSSKSMSKY